jgi:hypothetical protein
LNHQYHDFSGSVSPCGSHPKEKVNVINEPGPVKFFKKLKLDVYVIKAIWISDPPKTMGFMATKKISYWDCPIFGKQHPIQLWSN